jgi:RHS repeat-associated protein
MEFQFDEKNRLTNYRFGGSGSWFEIKYDALGKVRERVDLTPTATKYYSDGLQLIQQLDSLDNVEFDYFRGPTGLMRQWEENGTPTKRFYIKDNLDTVWAIVDPSNLTVKRYNYNSWGEHLDKDDSDFPTDTNFMRYIGCRLESFGDSSNQINVIYNLHHRHYLPVVASFLQRDPKYLRFPKYDSISLYSYCANNPTNFTDPIGLNQTPKGKPPFIPDLCNNLYPSILDTIKNNKNCCNELMGYSYGEGHWFCFCCAGELGFPGLGNADPDMAEVTPCPQIVNASWEELPLSKCCFDYNFNGKINYYGQDVIKDFEEHNLTHLLRLACCDFKQCMCKIVLDGILLGFLYEDIGKETLKYATECILEVCRGSIAIHIKEPKKEKKVEGILEEGKCPFFFAPLCQEYPGHSGTEINIYMQRECFSYTNKEGESFEGTYKELYNKDNLGPLNHALSNIVWHEIAHGCCLQQGIEVDPGTGKVAKVANLEGAVTTVQTACKETIGSEMWGYNYSPFVP